VRLAQTFLEKGFKYSNDQQCFESKRMILTQWIEYAKLSSVKNGTTLVLTKQYELIQHFCSHQYYTEASKIYLDINDKNGDRKQIVTRLDEEGRTDHLKALAKTLYSMPDKKHEGEAFTLAVTVGDHYADEKNLNLSNAECFYSMAFGWDNHSEELYSKFFKILGKQGKTFEAIRATVILVIQSWKEKGVKADPALQTRLNLMIDLLEDTFK
jgi:hypothetical protein